MIASVDFIVDCGARVGMGHLGRSRTLARALAEIGVASRFWVSEASVAPLVSDFPTARIPCAWTQTIGCAIVDGLEFSEDFIVDVRRNSERLVVIDDLAKRQAWVHYGLEKKPEGFEVQKLRSEALLHALYLEVKTLHNFFREPVLEVAVEESAGNASQSN